VVLLEQQTQVEVVEVVAVLLLARVEQAVQA
jgi:hypothetical protein